MLSNTCKSQNDRMAAAARNTWCIGLLGIALARYDQISAALAQPNVDQIVFVLSWTAVLQRRVRPHHHKFSSQGGPL